MTRSDDTIEVSNTTLKAQATSGVRWTAVASATNGVSELLRNLVLARLLFPADFGMMAMMTVSVGFAQMFTDMGISAAIIHHQNASKRELSSLYWLNVFSGWLVFGLFCGCIPLIVMMYHEPRLVHQLLALSTVFLITPLCSQFEILMQKQLAFDYLAKRDILGSITQTTLAIILAVLGFGVWSLVIGYLSNAVARALLLLPVGLRQFRPTLHFSRRDLDGYLSFGLFQIGERCAYYISQRADQIIVGSLLGAQALGYYSFAFNLAAQPLSRINPTLTKVAFPVFARLQLQPEKLKRGYMRLIGIVTAVNAPLLLGLAFIAPSAIPVIFGSKWINSTILVQMLCVVTLLRSINNPIGSVQYAKGRADLSFVWHVMTLICIIPIVLVACHFGHVAYVAFGILVLQASLTVPSYFMLIKPLLGACVRSFLRAAGPPVGAAVIMGFIVVLVPRLLSGSARLTLGAEVLTGGICYIFLLRAIDRTALVDISNAFQKR